MAKRTEVFICGCCGERWKASPDNKTTRCAYCRMYCGSDSAGYVHRRL
jgi:hypothetical protein